MPDVGASVERNGHTAFVRMRGDLVVPNARLLYGTLRGLSRRRDVEKIVLDFADVGRIDSAGVAVVSLMRRSMEHAGKELALDHVAENHAAAFELAPARVHRAPPEERVSWLETIGDRVLAIADTLRALRHLLAQTAKQSWAVMTRRRHLPTGALGQHVLLMGTDAVFIVGLLSFLLGMTIAFQGAVQLDKFGAGVFVADMVGWSMVREFAPLMTAIILSGRTGAAIAAELGTMRVNNEIDALTAMGVSPIRFLVVPRLVALTLVGPALTLMAAFVGIAGGFVVTAMTLDTSPTTFWSHIVYRVQLDDFLQCLSKALVFSWIIGITGSLLGLRATGDASSVGRATTRTVVVSVFLLVVVDALFATIITLAGDHR